jgi:hypothetical protein
MQTSGGIDKVEVITLHATTMAWRIQMEWLPSSMKRKIRFSKMKGGFEPWFEIELRQREKPFTLPIPELMSTRTGAYHPGSKHELGDTNWSVTIEHGIDDFASEKDFENFMAEDYVRQEGRYSLDENGNLVLVDIQDDKYGHSFNLDVYEIKINGKKPNKKLMSKYIKGRISWHN